MNYEKECSRTLDAEFEKKERISDYLKQIKNQIKSRINEIKTDIQRKESVIEERVCSLFLNRHLTLSANCIHYGKILNLF